MNKTRLALLFLFIAIPLVGGCQAILPSTGQAAATRGLADVSPERALVVYWHPLAGADEAKLLEMIDTFNQTNPWHITVVGEHHTSDLDALYNKVVAGISTDQLPSLVMTEPRLTAGYAANEIAVPLDPYLKSKDWGFTTEELADFFPDALMTSRLPQYENQLFSSPCCRDFQALYYNVDWLKELGYEEPPQTWEAFNKMACAASNPAEGRFGFEMGMDSSIFTSLLATQDIPLTNTGATAFTLGGDQGREALQYLQGLFSQGCANWESEQSQVTGFGEGRSLFVIDSTAHLDTYRDAVASEGNFVWSLAALPHTTDEPLVRVYGPAATILRTNPQEQLAAWLFLKWFSAPVQQVEWSGYKGCFSQRPSAVEEMADILQQHPAYELASQFLEDNWITEPRLAGYSGCRAAMGRMLYAVTAGEDVNRWFDETLVECNQALNEAAR
jgi:multiple sugar transport system substrate-binding protein